MRTLSAGMQAHLAGNAHKLVSMLRLDLADGTVLAFTSHDKPLVFDLGDGEVEYQPWTGIDVSAVVFSTGLEASNFEVSGPIGDLVARTAVLGGRFRKATARLFMVNWSSLGDGPIRLMKGTLGEGRVQGSRFVNEVRGLTANFNETWGRVLTPLCTATFGDITTGCPVVREPVPATVNWVGDDFRFAVDIGGEWPDDWFNLGAVVFLTGPLAGTAEATVTDYNGETGEIALLEPLPDLPEIGDTLSLFRGCSKLLKSDDPMLPTCLTYGAVEDFRGHPEVPGSRFYLRVKAPGASYA